MLRNGDNMWLYMPNLKRAVRVASRDSFMGGDFNNADVLRVNYTADYTATLAEESKDAYVLELKAKGKFVRIRPTQVTGRRFAVTSPEEWRTSVSDAPHASDE